MKLRSSLLNPIWLFAFFLTLSVCAHAADVSVDCSKKKTITAALASLTKLGPNTVHISGACNEAVNIDGFDRLTLVGDGTASINDPTPTSDPDLEDTTMIFIANASRVDIQNITVNGGAVGIGCYAFSVCRLFGVHVQGSAGNGVEFVRAYGFIYDNSVIENNRFNGLQVTAGGDVNVIPANTSTQPIFQNNGAGVVATDNSHVQLVATVQNNQADGIDVIRGSNLRLLATSLVTGNSGRGIFVRDGSAVMQASVTSNTGFGVSLGNLAFVQFSGATVTGNGGGSVVDVHCGSVTAATTGASTTGGTTDCTEPAP